MKTQFSALLIATLMGSVSLAQNSSVAEMPKNDDGLTKGIRVSVLAPMVEIQSSYAYRYGTLSSNDKPDSSWGVSVGYANLPVQQVGWTTNVAYLSAEFDGVPTAIYRADGNLAYTFNKMFNLKGGVNVGKINEAYYEDFHTGIGYQASLGVQFTKHIGMDLGYMEMKQTGSFNGADASINISGMEVGLNGTF